MKPTIKTLQKEIAELEKKVSKIPDMKACPECNLVKPLSAFEFRDNYLYGYSSPPYEHNHCESCDEAVEERTKAVLIAKKAPKKVIKWWGSGR